MGLLTKIERIERQRGVSVEQKHAQRRRRFDLESKIAEGHVRMFPEHRLVRREDCADEEVWHEIQALLATADGDEREANRLRALPAPRREAKERWINQATDTIEKIQRAVNPWDGDDLVPQALASARARQPARNGATP